LNRSMVVEKSMDQAENSAKTEKASLKDYYTVTKPGIIYANVLGTIAGFLVALGGESFTPSILWTFVWSILGITLVIASSTTLNNVFDRDIDGFMERTQNRPIHTGRISVRAGTIYALVLGITGELILTFGVHPLAAMLALVGLLVYVFIYTMWLKRTTTFNTVVGGISGAMPTMMGYVAVTENIDLTAWVIFAILFLWQPPHFLALAMRRTEEYRNAGIPMLPVVKGFAETKRQILFYTLAMIPVTMMLYNLQAVGLIYLAGVSILNVIYLWYALKGMSIKAEQEISWANFMFRYSVIYLTLLYILMMIDAK